MLINLTKKIGAKLKTLIGAENFSYQTFTYFIPAPSERKTGYREKQFDKTVFEFLKNGYEIVSINTQSLNGETSGLWVIIQVKTKKNNSEIDLQFPEFKGESNKDNQETSPEIEGLYYLD